MKIHGLQKLTLLDYPEHVACTVFLAGCNLRCPFCHNSELIPGNAPALMNDKELLAFLEKRTGLLEGVAVTGGEPLLSPGLPDLLTEIKALGYPVKLDTNGCFPDRLASLAGKGLVDYVAMDIKNSKDRYARTVGIASFDITPVEESVRFLLSGTVDYEFRTTAVLELHDTGSFTGIGQWISGAEKYFIQAFADRETVLCPGLSTPSPEDLKGYLEAVSPFVRHAELRGTSLS